MRGLVKAIYATFSSSNVSFSYNRPGPVGWKMNLEHEFEEFMKAYQDMVYTTALRLVANEAEAQDISQEVFLKAFERFEELSVSPTAGGWLRTVAKNLSLNHLTRYRARWHFFSEMNRHDEDESDFTANLPDTTPANDSLDQSERHRMLEDALQKLPSSQRVPLVLYHFEEMRYEDIAEHLGVSLSKVKTDIHRGRQTLEKRLQARRAEFTGNTDAPASSQIAF